MISNVSHYDSFHYGQILNGDIFETGGPKISEKKSDLYILVPLIQISN